MKHLIAWTLAACLLTGCAAAPVAEVTTSPETLPVQTNTEPTVSETVPAVDAAEYVSRFDSVTDIVLSDQGVEVSGSTDAVTTSNDIIYYEDRDSYDSGNPYGEGTQEQRHTAEEAAAHTVVNITAPGAYRISGSLSAGQIRIDLGEDAKDDPEAVVELILDNADITCTVAPAISFQNVYECDADADAETAQATVDTSAAGANLILEGENTVSGSHVARIYKDSEGEEKLWKQDGAVYSYMSMNVYGPGSLDLAADNEGLDTEMHLTIQGGDISIRSGNDGINTNEDGVSVTTINGGTLHIIAGLGAEGDGIDSNGYLVINGGTVVASANPASDAGLDADLGSYIHGGTVVALGSTMDWAESDSRQVTMNLQFADYQSSGSAIVVTREDGSIVFAYDPSEDEVLGDNQRQYQGAILSCPDFVQGETYQLYLDGTVTGEETGGVYTSVTGYEGGSQMQYTGSDLRGGRGGMPGGEKPDNFKQPPEGETRPEGQGRPEGSFDPAQAPGNGQLDQTEGFDQSQRPQGERPELPENAEGSTSQEPSTQFYMADKVNAFSGISPVSQ